MKITAPTWHNSAQKGDFARTVLMPGDPKRSRWIAETYLENARLVNDVRGVQGYTGTYHGRNVSVMASGMGIPTVSIYARELFEAYDVDNIIRIGTAGAISEHLGMMDVVAGFKFWRAVRSPVHACAHGELFAFAEGASGGGETRVSAAYRAFVLLGYTV